MYQSDSAPWLEFFAWNTDGTAKTDLVYNTSGISIVVVRDNLANSSALTLAAASGPTDWAAGKFHAMGGNKYRVGISTALISSFTGQISVEGSYTGGDITGTTRDVSAYNPTRNPSIAGDAMTLTSGQRVKLDATQSDYAPLLASGYTAPANSTIASIYALLQLTDSDVASIVALLGTPAGVSIAADLAAIKLSADAALRPIVAGRPIAVAATTGAVELDPASVSAVQSGLATSAQVTALSASTVQVASPNVSGNLVLTQGDDYDGTANPKASWTVTTDYTDGWSVTLTIRDVYDAVIYTTAGTVVSATVVAVTIAAPTGLAMTGCPGQWQGKFDVQLTKAGKKKTIALGVCYINEDQTR